MGNLTEEKVNKIIRKIENRLAKRMKDEIKRSEIIIMKAIDSLSENLLDKGDNNPCAESASGHEYLWFYSNRRPEDWNQARKIS